MNDSFISLADGRKLGFADYGQPDGIPIFLLHGTPGSRIWDFDKEPLISGAGLRIITPERPGYGISDPLKTRTIKAYSRDIEQLATHLNIKRFHIAGLSGGGPYTLACASALPEMVLSVTLIGSAIPLNMDGFFEGMASGNKLVFRISKQMPFLLKPLYSYTASVLRKKPEKFIKQIHTQLCPWDQAILRATEQKGNMETLISHIKEAYRQGAEGVYRDSVLLAKPWQIDFQSIKPPIMLWHGEADTLMPVTPARHFAKVLPNCESHFIPEAGHFLLESDEVGKLIIQSVKETHLNCL